ncbi:helix-turn-helix domain-containing protein [Asticcacaulis sp. BE141]|uniref:helix-turn-helix domain-containing protein n=1 Tax=Asticcacaulis TaxID=76890 RepID=UPI0038578DCF
MVVSGCLQPNGDISLLQTNADAPAPAPAPIGKTGLQPLSVCINDAAALIGVSRSSIYNLAREKRLRIGSIAGRSVVPVADLVNLVQEACA